MCQEGAFVHVRVTGLSVQGGRKYVGECGAVREKVVWHGGTGVKGWERAVM